jgi:hypothetical protein
MIELHPIKSWKEAWESAKATARVDVRFHDLRHTVVTRMLEGPDSRLARASSCTLPNAFWQRPNTDTDSTPQERRVATALPNLLRASRALQLIMMAVLSVVRAEGTVLDRVLDARHRTSCLGLRRKPYGTFHTAQIKTGWGSHCQRPVAIVEDNEIVASAEQYDLAGMIDGRAVPVCGIGSVAQRASKSLSGAVLATG